MAPGGNSRLGDGCSIGGLPRSSASGRTRAARTAPESQSQAPAAGRAELGRVLRLRHPRGLQGEISSRGTPLEVRGWDLRPTPASLFRVRPRPSAPHGHSPQPGPDVVAPVLPRKGTFRTCGTPWHKGLGLGWSFQDVQTGCLSHRGLGSVRWVSGQIWATWILPGPFWMSSALP